MVMSSVKCQQRKATQQRTYFKLALTSTTATLEKYADVVTSEPHLYALLTSTIVRIRQWEECSRCCHVSIPRTTGPRVQAKTVSEQANVSAVSFTQAVVSSL